NPQACVASDTVNVFVVSPPNAQIYEELVCAGEPLILRASEDQNVTYTWDAHPNLNNLTEASPVVRLHSDAIFRAKVSLGGCESQAEITVKIKPNPAISLVKDTTVCAKKPLILVNNGEFVVSNRWSIAGDPTIYTTPAFTMTPS